MVSNYDQQKNSELYWADIFSRWLNKRLESDYEPFINKKEKSIIDVFLRSSSKRFPKAQLQLTSSEPYVEYRLLAWQRKKSFKEREAISSNNAVVDIDKAIYRKTEEGIEKYGEAKIKQVILLVHGMLIEPAGENWFTDEFIEKYQKNSFAGIYYVRNSPERVTSIKAAVQIEKM